MSGRRAPRPASAALRSALEAAAPRTPLAALQAVWTEVVGETLAAHAEPVAEREKTIVVSCSDPVWAEELSMIEADLLTRLRERLGESAPSRLRFRVGEP